MSAPTLFDLDPIPAAAPAPAPALAVVPDPAPAPPPPAPRVVADRDMAWVLIQGITSAGFTVRADRGRFVVIWRGGEGCAEHIAAGPSDLASAEANRVKLAARLEAARVAQGASNG
jgi:hypothetical protein